MSVCNVYFFAYVPGIMSPAFKKICTQTYRLIVRFTKLLCYKKVVSTFFSRFIEWNKKREKITEDLTTKPLTKLIFLFFGTQTHGLTILNTVSIIYIQEPTNYTSKYIYFTVNN